MSIIIKLDRHEAIHTGAYTRWLLVTEIKGNEFHTVNPHEILKQVKTTYAHNKTHWEDYFLVENPNMLFLRIRKSNRGNEQYHFFYASQLAIPEEEAKVIMSCL